MKIVITIYQNRRVVLPHIFIRYILPKMRAVFPGEIEAVVIQHRSDASGGNRRLESLRHSTDALQRVRDWTERGMFDGAEVRPHEVIHRPYPSIPTFHRGVEAALERDADFHVWMEDDALIVDFDCAWWDKLLGNTEVGVYRKFHYLNPAYMVTRRSFAERIREPLSRYDDWKESSRLERFLAQQMVTSRTYLNPARAVRYHHKYYPYTGIRYVVEAVREHAPEALELLDVDFGEGTHLLPPVSPAEMAAHARADGASLPDRARRAYWLTKEELRRRREGRPSLLLGDTSWRALEHWRMS